MKGNKEQFLIEKVINHRSNLPKNSVEYFSFKAFNSRYDVSLKDRPCFNHKLSSYMNPWVFQKGI